MDRSLLKYAEANVPRYTSYPTAAHFDASVGEAEYRHWLSEISRGDTLSLYVHIPFCESLCWYCGCHTTVPNDYSRASRYLDRLLIEIDRVADAVPDNGGVAHLHFGGGTPTYLTPKDLSRLIGHLRERFEFQPDAEVAVEIDPRTLTGDMAEAMAASGVNRVSLGVQDFASNVQDLIHRRQPYALVAKAVERLRANGIGAISFDLMYGLPGQDTDSVARTAVLAAVLEPARLSVFGYAHVPWFKKHQRAIDEAALPGTEDRFAQAASIDGVLRAEGYIPIGFDHYCLPGDALARTQTAGTLRRNFQGYTIDTSSVLIGFGASAIGTLRGGHVQNEPNLAAYAAAVDEGRLPVVRGVTVGGEDRMRWAAIERVMCDFALDIADHCRAHGRQPSALDDALPGLQELSRDGLVAVDGRRIRVTGAGRRFVRNVAYCFDARSHISARRHSRAV